MMIRLGTRGSELARTQSGHVADALRALGHEVELVVVKTEGDERLGSLVAEGGTGWPGVTGGLLLCVGSAPW